MGILYPGESVSAEDLSLIGEVALCGSLFDSALLLLVTQLQTPGVAGIRENKNGLLEAFKKLRKRLIKDRHPLYSQLVGLEDEGDRLRKVRNSIIHASVESTDDDRVVYRHSEEMTSGELRSNATEYCHGVMAFTKGVHQSVVRLRMVGNDAEGGVFRTPDIGLIFRKGQAARESMAASGLTIEVLRPEGQLPTHCG
ncbi:hypothetical protein [Cryobacterium zhongshanensis]|uniref:Uncharacterized protein n=1 Tax=Cryobacterium zhongshanensis TaxID=2928153 RepID=A0AA41QY20_9MICO|nr:hypothetical protein [Cryobacterium zhongshanensis]MCI4659577.1 hypothetical protein [Cryobacterium zhongshanensis]